MNNLLSSSLHSDLENSDLRQGDSKNMLLGVTTCTRSLTHPKYTRRSKVRDNISSRP